MDYKNDILILDCETPIAGFLVCIYDLENDQKVSFEINQYKNELYSFIKFLDINKHKYHVGWNNLGFDNPIIEFIWRNYENWYDLSNQEICRLIWQEAQDTIDNSNYDRPPKYWEKDLSFKIIDLWKIHHLDNKNRRSNGSLKAMEYYLDMDVETFDFTINQEVFSQEELDRLKFYCFHDIEATYQMYLLTIGETENPVYKGNNQIQIRLDNQEQYKISCMNYSSSKIGDEIIKKFYCEEKGIQYKELPRKGTFRKEVRLKYSVPSYIKFQTPKLSQLVDTIKKTTLKQDEAYTNKIKLFGQIYSLMKGGLHNEIENKVYHSDEEYVILDLDVSSFYIICCLQNEYYPYHLGKDFLRGYKRIYDERIRLKPLAKTDKKVKGIVQGLKDAGVSVYGKSSDIQSWLFDRQMTINICITGELSLLMLIEQMELSGSKCIMANTDGASFIVKKSEIDKFHQVADNWSKMTNFELEEIEYKSMWFANVNNYLAIKSDGTIKKKGDAFLTDFEIFKDKSFRILGLALEEYFVKGIKPEEFIPNHPNLFDFCARAKVNKSFYLKAVNKKTGEELNYNKLLRYYTSKNGVKLYKMKREECDTNAADISEINAGKWLSTVINEPSKEDLNQHLQNVDYQFYIEKVREVIFKLEFGRKPSKNKIIDKNQISLF